MAKNTNLINHSDTFIKNTAEYLCTKESDKIIRAWIDRKGGRAVDIIRTRLPSAAGYNRKSVTSVRIGLVKKTCEEKLYIRW